MTDSIVNIKPLFSSERSALIGSVYRQIADDVACLFQRWPRRTVSKITVSEILRHIGHPVTLTIEHDNALRLLRCRQCRTTMVL